jgi:hypothetical protein
MMLRRFAHNIVARRSLCLAMLIGVASVGSLCAGEEVIILDAQKTDVLVDWDKRVLSDGSSWQVVDDSGDRVIKFRSESSSLSLEKRIVVDLRQTPYLEWAWKVTVLPKGGDLLRRSLMTRPVSCWLPFPRRLSSGGKSSPTSGTPRFPKGPWPTLRDRSFSISRPLLSNQETANSANGFSKSAIFWKTSKHCLDRPLNARSASASN